MIVPELNTTELGIEIDTNVTFVYLIKETEKKAFQMIFYRDDRSNNVSFAVFIFIIVLNSLFGIECVLM